MKYQLRFYFLVIALATFITGCTSNFDEEGNQPSQFKLVTFELKSALDQNQSGPSMSLPSGEFTFCFFNAGSEHSSKLVYKTSLTGEEMQGVDGNYKVSIKVPGNLSGTMKLVTMFNFDPEDNLGVSYKNFRKSLSYVVPSEHYELLPMWGEVDFEMKEGVNNIQSTVLLRSYARVNVLLDKHDTAAKYKMNAISSVRIYLPRSYGSVYPYELNVNSIGMSVDKPSIPTVSPASGIYNLGNGLFTNNIDEAVKHPLLYDYKAAPTTSVFNEVFLPEVLHAKKQDFKTVMCVVVGVHLEGMDGVERFYRLDFSDYDANKRPVNFKSILRNKSYTFQLKGASTNGFPDPEEALHNPIPVFMDVQIWENYTQDLDLITNFFFKHSYDNKPFTGQRYEDVFIYYDTDLSAALVEQNLKVGFDGKMGTQEGTRFSVVQINYDNKYLVVRAMKENKSKRDISEVLNLQIFNQKFNLKLTQNSL